MARRKPIRKRYALSVWPTWLLIGVAWVIARLPLSWIFSLGEAIGRLAYRLGGARRRIAETNIRHCFPELSAKEQDDLVKQTFESVTLGGLEMAIPWLNPKRDLSGHFTVHGQAHLDSALSQGRGAIVVGGHFAVMDAICQPLRQIGNIDVMYRFNKNPAWEWLQVQGRKHFFNGVIEREDIRGTLKRLKQGRAVWYAADQDYGSKHSVFAPFFSIPAATIVATSRFARLNDSPVLMMAQIRDRQNLHWHIHFSPVLENFPSGDDTADATRLNQLLEQQIRQNPAQYLWMHKRFKTRPQGEAKFYPL